MIVTLLHQWSHPTRHQFFCARLQTALIQVIECNRLQFRLSSQQTANDTLQTLYRSRFGPSYSYFMSSAHPLPLVISSTTPNIFWTAGVSSPPAFLPPDVWVSRGCILDRLLLTRDTFFVMANEPRLFLYQCTIWLLR